MDAVEFFKMANRLCEKGCAECPIRIKDICIVRRMARLGDTSVEDIEEMVSKVEQWAKDNPIKTRQSEFLKMFPNARIESDGMSSICPIVVDKRCHNKDDDALCCLVRDEEECRKCRRDFWLAEIKDGEA